MPADADLPDIPRRKSRAGERSSQACPALAGHLAQLGQHGKQHRLLAHQERWALGPARRDVGQRERLCKASPCGRTSMRDKVGIKHALAPDPPVIKSPDRYATSELCSSNAAPPSCSPPLHMAQQSVDGRCTYRRQLRFYIGRRVQMPGPLHRLQ